MAILPPPVPIEAERPRGNRRRRRLTIWVRLGLVLIALMLVGVFRIAVRLDPYEGEKVWLEETHTQLGLPRCTFKSLTGLPCPSCGMSTSFAWLIRGNVWNSLRANQVGTLLAVAALLFIPWGLACAGSGRLLAIRNWEWWLIRLVLCFVILLFLRWGVVLALADWD